MSYELIVTLIQLVTLQCLALYLHLPAIVTIGGLDMATLVGACAAITFAQLWMVSKMKQDQAGLLVEVVRRMACNRA